MNGNTRLIQNLSRRLILLEGSQLAKTKNMQFWDSKVQLYKEIKDLKEELKLLGGVSP
jgi:hypothetical protein